MTPIPLVALSELKADFPLWEDWCTTSDGQTADDVFSRQVARAEVRLLEYVIVTADNVTSQLKVHLLNLVRYNCFNVLHGDESFDPKPQVVRDYEETVTMLERYKSGDFDGPIVDEDEDGEDDRSAGFSVSAKTRRFGSGDWFTPEDTAVEL